MERYDVQLMRMVGAIGAAALALALPLFGQSQAAFEFSAVAVSNDDIPAVLTGTSEQEDSLNIQICNELGKGVARGAVAHGLHLSPSELQSHIDAFVRAELLRADGAGSFTPAFPIIHRSDAAWFQGIDKPLVGATVRTIEARERELLARFQDILHLDAEQGRALSLMLFGDTLFDRWQTKNVRMNFVQGYPPTRNGKVFYLAALQRVPGSIGSLGMYTHSEALHGDAMIVTYGHARELDPSVKEKPEKVPHLIESYVAFVHGASGAAPELQAPGFVREGKPQVAVVTQSEYAKLPEIANSFAEELLRLLNADRPKIFKAYQSSRYARAVSFQEFALWWYHFFDAAVVDRLIKDGLIAVPAVGYATLIVLPG
jgi:hypothetical protein